MFYFCHEQHVGLYKQIDCKRVRERERERISFSSLIFGVDKTDKLICFPDHHWSHYWSARVCVFEKKNLSIKECCLDQSYCKWRLSAGKMGSSAMDPKKTDSRKKWTRRRTTLRLNMPVSCPVTCPVISSLLHGALDVEMWMHDAWTSSQHYEKHELR